MANARQITNHFNGKLQKIFQDFFYQAFLSTTMNCEDVIETYLTKDFTAYIDGKRFNRNLFSDRIQRMRKEAIVEEQNFLQMMEQDQRLFTQHTVSGLSITTNHSFKTQAIAFLIFKNNKIQTAYLNSATQGDPNDQDIASRS